ncbi:MAG: molybdenum cofactor guanylyltransferase [Planctomycetota bacterium]
MSEAAIVLAGGRSRRMGQDKATLPFGDETLLDRTVRIVRKVVPEVLVVSREDQPRVGDFRVVHDSSEGLGPLAGLVMGLEVMSSERAFLTSCDVPFLKPEYLRRMIELSQGYPITVPLVDGYHMTTSAVYTRDVLPIAQELLAARRLRPLFLVEAVDARIVTADDLRDVDPDLQSFRNCNTQEEYEQALRDAGFA